VLLKGFITILLAAFLSAGASFFINTIPRAQTEFWWVSLITFSVIFIILNFLYNIKSNFRSYSELLLGTIAGKTFALLIFIFIYSVVDKKGLFSFAMHFIAHYILFTLFEMRYLFFIIKNRDVNKS
jgi:hypothetical protein